MPLSSSSSVGRRRSMVILQSASSIGTGEQVKQLQSEDSSNNRQARDHVLSSALKADQEKAQQLKRENGKQQVTDELQRQQHQSAIKSCSNDHKSQSDFSRDRTLSKEIIPTVRPRTSILKSEQSVVGEERTCDINNNQRGNKSAIRSSLRGTTRSAATTSDCCSLDEQQQSKSALKSEIKAKSSPSTLKPKSILKTSKSVPRKQQQPVDDDSTSSDARSTNLEKICNAQVSTIRDIIDGSTTHLHDKDECTDSHSDQPSYTVNKSKREETLKSHKASREQRRSACLTGDFLDPKEEDEDELEDEDSREDSADRRQAFERLRLRASCYDITSLMSKNGLQSQLYKLRSNSTNTISGRLRQRQPAQLLLDEPANESCKNNDQIYDDTKKQRSPRASEPSQQSSTVISIKKSNEPVGEQGSHDCYSEHSLSASKETISPTTHCETNGCVKKSEHDLRPAPAIKTQRAEPALTRKQVESLPRHPRVGSSATSEVSNKVAYLDETASTRSDNQHTSALAVVGRRDTRESSKDAALASSESASEIDEDEELGNRHLTGSIARSSTTLSKSGPFNLLRQSFNQKTLSSMLKFPTRASMRIKSTVQSASASTSIGDIPNGNDKQTADPTSNAPVDKSAALAIAEANLLAAKQLKQQAQRLKEQQKREQQQQSAEAAELMMAAVQYNQQIQRQQHQQLFYLQQQYVAARGHMFDPTAMHLAQQQMYQQFHRQQQQMAYLANLNSGQYMQQMTTAMVAPTTAVPMVSGQPMMYMPAPMGAQHAQIAGSQSMIGSFQRKSLARASGKSPHQQHMIPMAVNHHSSFNIVYTGSSGASQIPQLQQSASIHSYDESHEDAELAQGHKLTQAPAKIVKSSLGASMRKTVKSILVNKSSFLTTLNNGERSGQTGCESPKAVEQIKLKSAIKTSSSRDLVLNSEGSDGDGSSSDSTTAAASNSLGYALTQGVPHQSYLRAQTEPKSALKKTMQQTNQANQKLDTSSKGFKPTVSILNSDGRPRAELESRQRYLSKSQTLSRATAKMHSSSHSSTGRKNVRFYLDS